MVEEELSLPALVQEVVEVALLPSKVVVAMVAEVEKCVRGDW